MEGISQYEKVEQKDLRVGDMILPVPKEAEFQNNVVTQVSDRDGDVETNESYYSPKVYDFYLVKRAPVVLPEKVGSVVRVSTNLDPEGSHWMLTHDSYWVSTSKTTKSFEEFQGFVRSHNVEVIA